MVGGYLLFRSLIRKTKEGSFRYLSFILNKVDRLWPLILIGVFASLIIGYFLMLPDDYENLAESAIASSVFGNNFLMYITSKDYWDILNLFKPLMHLWYIGVLMQAYVVIPLILMLVTKIWGKTDKAIRNAIFTITSISFVLYLLPFIDYASKFYLLPFRIFEISVGGALLYLPKTPIFKKQKVLTNLAIAVIIVILSLRSEFISNEFMVIITVIATAIYIIITDKEEHNSHSIVSKRIAICFAAVGKRSYSIYIWHQIVIAFCFYSMFEKHNILALISCIVVTGLISIISYRFVENRKSNNKAFGIKNVSALLCVFVLICGYSYYIYSISGVVRDVPEMDISRDNVHKHMHWEYVDRVYEWNNDFQMDDKVHILVIGNSFGRDWANILFEKDQGISYEISYLFYPDPDIEKYNERFNAADYVFYAMGPKYNDVPLEVESLSSIEKFYVVGNKNYGESNGIFYSHRGQSGYYEQEFNIPDELRVENNLQLGNYGVHYIDMLSPVMNEDGNIRVFTDNNKFISQDCSHLTKAGAQYYARILDIDRIIQK